MGDPEPLFSVTTMKPEYVPRANMSRIATVNWVVSYVDDDEILDYWAYVHQEYTKMIARL